MSKIANILGTWLTTFSIGNKTASDVRLSFINTFVHFLVAPNSLSQSNTWTLPNQSGTLALTNSYARLFSELLTVSSVNTLSNLTYAPDNTSNIQIIVNGKSESYFTGAFTISGTTITWNAANAGYNIETTYEVVARYTTLS